MDFLQFFSLLGFTKQEADIFLTLYKIGTKPASAVARHVKIERTNVYKKLCLLVKKGLVMETMKSGVKHFFIPDVHILKSYVAQQIDMYHKLLDNFPAIEAELLQYKKYKQATLPKITFFDGNAGMKNIYQDIYDEVTKRQYMSIKFFSSNTFSSQIAVDSSLKDYAKDMFVKLQKKNIWIDTYLGDGILIMEHITKTTNIDNLGSLPAGNSAINIFVVGKSVYIIIYKDIPFGLKLDSEDLAYAMHFLFEKLQVE